MQSTRARPGSDLIVVGDEQLNGLIIANREGDALLQAARAQRADPRYGHYPLFAMTASRPLDGVDGDELDMLLDGFVDDEADAAAIAAEHWRPIGELRRLPATSPEARLLGYLALRPSDSLRPLRDWRSRAVYRYPLLGAFGADESGEILGLLAARGVLMRRELIERLRLCPSCSGAHLLFVDICSNCSSIDIAADESIHCFRCGHVESQGRFMAGAGLQCPNCHARLRHIGTDYDRPLEHYLCRRCGERFTEPDVIARCSICAHESHPDMLTSREAGRYQLTEYGRLCALEGRVGPGVERFDANRCLDPERFEHCLDWQLEIHRSHPHSRFALLYLQLREPGGQAGDIDATPLRHLGRDFAERLPEFIGPADVCTRTGEAEFWVLLPQSEAASTRQVLERLQASIEQTGPRHVSAAPIVAQLLASARLADAGISAHALMADLRRAAEAPASA